METNELNTENIVSKAPSSNNNEKNEIQQNPAEQKPEEALDAIASCTLILGIVASILLLIVGFAKIERHSTEILGWSSFIASAYLLITSIITWGVLKVLCNISNNLREINKKLK